MTKPLNFPYPDEWPSAVAAYLLDKQEARLAVLAKEALGISGMPNRDWWHLIFILWRLGWIYRGDGGAIVRRRS